MPSEQISKITDAEKKEKAQLLIAKFNERDDLLETFLEHLSETYTTGARVNILKAAVKLGGVRRNVPVSRKALIFKFFIPVRRMKGILDSILFSFELIVLTELDEDSVLVDKFSEILELASDRKNCILNEQETVDLVKRLSCGGSLLRMTLEAKMRTKTADFEYLLKWASLLQPLLGVRSVGQGIKQLDAESILSILISLPREKLPDQAFLSLPRLAHVGGSTATSKLMRSCYSDFWNGMLVETATVAADASSSDSDDNELSSGQIGLLVAIREEFAVLGLKVREAAVGLEDEAKRYNLLNDKKNELEREFNTRERELESKIYRLKAEVGARTDERDKLQANIVDLQKKISELSKEIDQLNHQNVLGGEIEAHSQKDQLDTLMLKPVENMRGLVSSALIKNPDIKELKGIAVGLEQFVRRLERKFELSLGNRIREDLYRKIEE